MATGPTPVAISRRKRPVVVARPRLSRDRRMTARQCRALSRPSRAGSAASNISGLRFPVDEEDAVDFSYLHHLGMVTDDNVKMILLGSIRTSLRHTEAATAGRRGYT